MAQVVSRRPLTAENRLRNQTTAHGIYVGRSGTWTGFFASTSMLRTIATQSRLDTNQKIFRPIRSNEKRRSIKQNKKENKSILS
jgi:hypothetical protein